MANLPEKNITLVDKITSIPSNSNLFLNADGEFRQASVNDVIKSATVVSDTVNNAINDAMQDSIDSHFKQATGSPILLTDTADGTLIDFKAYGRSTQNGTPTPDSPIAIDSVADGGYFDGELLGGYYDASGVFVYGSNTTNVGNKNPIPCKGGDNIKIIYKESISAITTLFYDENMMFIERQYEYNINEFEITAPSNAKYMNFHLSAEYIITPATAKPITVTINGEYAFIEKSVGKNRLDITKYKKIGGEIVTINDNTATIKAGSNVYGLQFSNADVGLEVGHVYTLSSKTAGGTTSGGWRLWYADDTLGTPVGANAKITVPAEVKYILYYIGSPYTGTTDITISEMQIEEGTVATEYEPHKEKISYIPLSAPLRSSLDGTVTDEASLTEVNRKFTEDIFDGSSDEKITLSGVTNGYGKFIFTLSASQIIDNSLEMLSSHFVVKPLLSTEWANPTENCILKGLSATTKSVIGVVIQGITTVEAFKTWLQANPVTLIYELAEPITETIEPVDIVTYDNVTYLTASDNAEMELEYPTSKVAGIASIGYSKGRKAEYEVELLKAQLLELQTAMVNSL